MENLVLCVHTVIKSLNLEISLAVWQAASKKCTYLNACHTCSMTIFPYYTIHNYIGFLALLLALPMLLLKTS